MEPGGGHMTGPDPPPLGTGLHLIDTDTDTGIYWSQCKLARTLYKLSLYHFICSGPKLPGRAKVALLYGIGQVKDTSTVSWSGTLQLCMGKVP